MLSISSCAFLGDTILQLQFTVLQYRSCWDEIQIGWDGSQPIAIRPTTPRIFLTPQYFRTKMEILLFSKDVHGGNIPNVVGNFLKQNL